MRFQRILSVLVLIGCVWSSPSLAYHDKKLTADYRYEKDCIALLSLARDLTLNAEGKSARYRVLTDAQNKLYLKHPSGHFRPKHIDAAKFLHKQRLREKGASYLQMGLRKCGVP